MFGSQLVVKTMQAGVGSALVDDRSQVPIAYTQAATDWLSEAGQALLARVPQSVSRRSKQMQMQL